MPLATREYLVGVCDSCAITSPELSSPHATVFTSHTDARQFLPKEGWTVDDTLLCPSCTCAKDGHDLTRPRKNSTRRSCRRCGTAWHNPHRLSAPDRKDAP